MATNNNIATVRTAAAVSWGTGIGLLVEWIGDVEPQTLLFVVAAATLVINRVGTELQQSSGRWLKVVGDILLWVDKTPVYESPPAPVEANP